MQGRGIVVALLAIIVVLTVSLASLVGFIFFNGKISAANLDTKNDVVLPKDSELIKIDLLNDRVVYNLRPDEKNSKPVMQLGQITLSCYKKVDGIKDVEQKLNFNKNEICETIGMYFRSVYLHELAEDPNYIIHIKKELKDKINNLLTENENRKNEIVYDVIFVDMFYQ